MKTIKYFFKELRVKAYVFMLYEEFKLLMMLCYYIIGSPF